MKIAALNPPFLPRFSRESRSPAVAKSGTLYYPMWLAYAVGYLEKHGHQVLLIDAPATGLSFEETACRIADFSPDLVILDTSTPSIYSDIETAAGLKKNNPGLFTVMVGAHVSALPEETMAIDPAVDAVAFGEYEATLVELAGALASNGGVDALRAVDGIVFRDGSGNIVRNKARPFLDALDDLPMVSAVYKKHLSIEPYFYGHSRHPLIVIVTGRGCPFHCTYCVVPQVLQGHRYRRRSVENVVAEFRYIRDNFPHVKEIMIEDDTLTADPSRCRELSKALIAANAAKIPWSANSRADVDFETMTAMKKAGCRLFCVGFESGDQEILNNIKKGTNLEKIRRFVKDAKRAGILVHGCFMVGNRGETRQTLETTLRFAKELSPDTAQFFPIMVYPGTSDYRYFKEKGWIVTEDFRKWLTDDGLHSSVVSNPDLSYGTLVDFCDRARREFYLRPGYIAGKALQALRDPGEFKRLIKGFRTIVPYLLRSSLKRGVTAPCRQGSPERTADMESTVQ
jgi:anaerobic magnesium-protoporphyrin IX monomethyl ester cyclase